MAATAIAQQRLSRQGLTERPFQTPDAVVAWLGAVQAQDYPGAKWSLGLRMQDATDAMIEQAFSQGTILRTHVMRPTWHFVTPADIRWLLALTAPRVNTVNTSAYRQLELDDALFVRSSAALTSALQGGRHLTRAELGAALARAGIVAEGRRLGYIVHRAELDALVCSGPRRGKQFTYALLDERAPRARMLQRDEALAELTRRYFTGHGPATIRDFVWWSGLTVADAKAGLAMVGSDLSHEQIDGQTYYCSPSSPSTAQASNTALLLPTYDELLVGFAGFDQARRGGPDSNNQLVFDSTIAFGGQILGSWRRTFKPNEVMIEIAPFVSLTAAQEAAIAGAAQRYADFVEMPARWTYAGSSADD